MKYAGVPRIPPSDITVTCPVPKQDSGALTVIFPCLSRKIMIIIHIGLIKGIESTCILSFLAIGKC